ncbi:MAG: Sua5/YciO/YrdC/YwlC family protein, partial [Bacteroidaceae bacterium]|nr:Sua5/YciO/YrdC/YwlC family protein [Bacteroidaceae bacterium]
MTQKQIAEDIKTAVQTLRKGGLILYPTDTIWGIGCDASNEDAVRRIFQLKQREDSKAMICLVDNANRMQRYLR